MQMQLDNFMDTIYYQLPYKDWMSNKPTTTEKRKYLLRIARLKTITSAPSLMVLVLNPLPSRNRCP